MSTGTRLGTPSAELDQRGACPRFDALVKVSIQAVAADELKVAEE